MRSDWIGLNHFGWVDLFAGGGWMIVGQDDGCPSPWPSDPQLAQRTHLGGSHVSRATGARRHRRRLQRPRRRPCCLLCWCGWCCVGVQSIELGSSPCAAVGVCVPWIRRFRLRRGHGPLRPPRGVRRRADHVAPDPRGRRRQRGPEQRCRRRRQRCGWRRRWGHGPAPRTRGQSL